MEYNFTQEQVDTLINSLTVQKISYMGTAKQFPHMTGFFAKEVKRLDELINLLSN